MGFDKSDSDQGSFNQAVAFVNRLNELQKNCSMFRRMENLDDWKDELDSIYNDVYPFIVKDKRESSLKKNHEQMKQYTDGLKGEYRKIIKSNKGYGNGFDKRFDRVASKFHVSLDYWERLLKVSIDHHGLLMPKQDDPRFAITA